VVKRNGLRVRPVDKRDHYIKRCLGLPGDSLQIIDNQVYVNGKALENPSMMQFMYVLNGRPITQMEIGALDKFEITESDIQSPDRRYLLLTPEQASIIADRYPDTGLTIVKNNNVRPLATFPNDPKNFNTWTIDNFGPIYIPKQGDKVVITPNNIALYKRIINVYENHDLEIKSGDIYIDGKKTTSYTIEQDYYWAMGDNRHASEDSRFWGFVPHDHIVGKPIFVWMSLKDGNLFKGIRWNRIFKKANVM